MTVDDEPAISLAVAIPDPEALRRDVWPMIQTIND